MDKPKKKYCGKSYFADGCVSCPYSKESHSCGTYKFNKLIDDYEKWLKSRQMSVVEIVGIMKKFCTVCMNIEDLATVIHKEYEKRLEE